MPFARSLLDVLSAGVTAACWPARSPSVLPESAGSSHRQSAREHWRCCCQRTRCGRDREPSEETSRSRRRSDLLASSGSSNKNSTGRLRMPMHESEIGIRTGKLTVADRGELIQRSRHLPRRGFGKPLPMASPASRPLLERVRRVQSNRMSIALSRRKQGFESPRERQ